MKCQRERYRPFPTNHEHILCANSLANREFSTGQIPIYRAVTITENPVILSGGEAGVEGSSHFKSIAVQVKIASQKILRLAMLAQNDKPVSVFLSFKQRDKLEFGSVLCFHKDSFQGRLKVHETAL